MKKDISFGKAPEIFFAEAMRMFQTANDRKIVLFDSGIAKSQENVKAFRDVSENRSNAMSSGIDAFTHSLKKIAHCVVHAKHFSNLAFNVEN